MMQSSAVHRTRPKLREVVVEASLALACLDADRLEQLVVSCQALERDCAAESAAEREERARQARDASGEMTVFGRVLEATRANLEVMKRLHERQTARLEYCGMGKH